VRSFDVEDGCGAHLILDVNCVVLSFEANMDVTEINVLLHEDTPAFGYTALTA
jgi:hypothetical protein